MLRGRTQKQPHLKILHNSTMPITYDPEITPAHPLSDEPTTSVPVHFNGEQREIWETCIRDSPPKLIKRLDSGVLEAYVVALDLHRRAVIEMAEGGLLHTEGQRTFAAPLIGLIGRQGELVRKLASELGFTPVSRPRILADSSNTPAMAASRTAEARSGPKALKDAPRRSLDAYLSESLRKTGS